MIISDQRKYVRNIREQTHCVLDEIDLLFPVVELSAHGFSLVCPKDETRLQEQLELNEISILNSDSQEMIHATGVIVHRSEFDEFTDRVGVRLITKRLDNTVPGAVRLPRRQPAIELTGGLVHPLGEMTGQVIDYNVSSVRLLLSNSMPVSVGDDVRLSISTDSRVLYEGDAEVVRVLPEQSEVVVQFLDKLLEVKSISIIEKALYTRDLVKHAASELDEFAEVDAEYKAIITDWRMYLDSVARIVDREEQKKYLKSEEEERQFLEEIQGGFVERMRGHMLQFNRAAERIEAPRLDAHKAYLRRELEHHLRRSPMFSSSIDKARGYSGDFETIKQFFADPYKGQSLFGKLANKFMMSLEPVTAHVDRIDYLYREIAAAYGQSKEGLRVLSLGAGPAEEILQLVDRIEISAPITVTLIDGDAYALSDFYERFQYYRSENVTIELVNYNAISILINKFPDLESESYDITYCAGMLDYFKDRFCRKFVDFLVGLTKPGGAFYFTNVHPRNSARYLMDFGPGWELYHRDEEQTRSLAPPNFQYEVTTDPTGTNVYVKGTKSNGN
jgi:extracellular factor (EF) 3-hydroxypalmitic acid methyl ester biosynthesis protein